VLRRRFGEEPGRTSGEPRDVVTKLLKIGLDILAVHYGMMLMRKPGEAAAGHQHAADKA
jgi:hypothetical protein